MKDQIMNWFREYGGRLGLLLGVLLVAVLSFEAGYFYQGTKATGSLIVSLPPEPVAGVPAQAVAGEAIVLPVVQPVVAVLPKSGDCWYVGSKNSTKYHLATCAVAKRIKPENRLCFATKEEAEKRGYVPSCMK